MEPWGTATDQGPVDDRFRLVDTLGTGMSGTVYRAVDVTTGRQVALKCLHADRLADADAVKRFVQEARATQRVIHPHVVKVLDAGVDEGGRPWLVTELMEGETLAAHIAGKPGPMDLHQAATVMLPVLDALGAAHAVGMVHRDVKPENIFLRRGAGGQPFPMLLDFGISKLPAAATLTGGMMTVPGAVFGTPHYMSPEQALSSRDVDARADVWSAGVLLYRLTVGRVPFDGHCMGDVLGNVLYAVPASPAATGVPGAVARVVMRCLARPREDRYPHAGAVRRALAESLGLPDAAGTPGCELLPRVLVQPDVDTAVTLRPPSRFAGAAPAVAVVRGVGLGEGPRGIPPTRPPAARVPRH